MKINIWIKKEEAISGNITKYYSTEPVGNLKDPDKYETDYVQVSISRDEFTRLEDKQFDLKNNIRAQYSKTLDNAYRSNKTEGMIHERNPDTGEIRSRKINVSERTEKDNFEKFVFSLNGGEFQEWHDRASEEEKENYSKLLDNRKSKQNR